MDLTVKSRICISLLLIYLGSVSPAMAFTNISARIEPIQPLRGDDFVIVIEGLAETSPVTLEEILRDDQSLEVRLHRPACPALSCLPQAFRLDVLIDGSSNPFAEGGLVELSIKGRVGAETDRDFLDYSQFPVGAIFFHSMEPRIVLNPWTPTDNDRLQVLVPVRANVCGPGTPWLDQIERDGSLISVFLRFSPGFGGEFSTHGELNPKCTPAVPFLSVTPVDLGRLEAGSYQIDLYLESTRDDSFPVRVYAWPFEVLDEPDVVALQQGRFNVEIQWMDADGNSGVGRPVPGPTPDSTLFTFFGDDNWEILVKVLDGCALNDRFWVFGAAATDVEYTITVTDTVTSSVWTYTNPLGTASAAINDTDAFATCPAQ